MVQIINSYKLLLEIRSDWDSLIQQASDTTFFQTFNFIELSCRIYPEIAQGLNIIVHRNKSKDIDAIFPFYIDNKHRLRFINDKHADFCNAVISVNVNAIYDLMLQVWQVIEISNRIKFVFLDNLIPQSIILSYWKVFAINGFVFSQTEHTWLLCPCSDNTLKEFKHLKSSKRSKILNDANKSAHCELTIFRCKEKKYPKREINEIIGIMLDTKTRTRSYFNAKMMGLMQGLYECGLVEISLLYDDGKPVSAGFTYYDDGGNKEMLWIIIYTHHKYNLWNNYRYMMKKSKISDHLFDFGRGGYDYKVGNFHPNIESEYRFLYSKTKWGNLYILFKICISHLRKTFNKYKKC